MSFTRTVVLPVNADEAFALITDPERLRRWQTVVATVDLRAGGELRWTITPGHVAAGTYREIEPGRRVVFGWGWEGSDELPPDASTITITLEPAADGATSVTVQHDGLPAGQLDGHAEGWNHYLDRLVTLASTGDAGPDEWAYAPQDLTPITAAQAALAVLQPVLRNLTADDREKPTPCADFTCHGLAEHLMESLERLSAMAGVPTQRSQTGTLESKVSALAATAIDAWSAMDLTAMIEIPQGPTIPAGYLVGVLPVELTLHGWDLAQGSGQQLHISDELVDFVHQQVAALTANGRGENFGPELEAGEGADAMARLAAFAGRKPLVTV